MIYDGKLTIRFRGGPLEGERREVPAKYDEDRGRWYAPEFYECQAMRLSPLFPKRPAAEVGQMQVYKVVYRIHFDDAHAVYFADLISQEGT